MSAAATLDEKSVISEVVLNPVQIGALLSCVRDRATDVPEVSDALAGIEHLADHAAANLDALLK